jgi:hypothetical protein
MIWFSCKKCGKAHGRPAASAGALIFCECGEGNIVPWDSTIAEPAPQAADVPPTPDLAPVTFDVEPEKAEATPERRRRGRAEKRDPERCFNHQNVAKTGTCEDCEESFCSDCLVLLQGASLCGPCKNFRARRLELPPRHSSLASASLVLALLTSPLALCQVVDWQGPPSMRLVSLLSLVPQLLALALGGWALYRTEKQGRLGGEALAVTGIATASLMCVLTALLHVAGARGMF